MGVINTGGNFKRGDDFLYFLASDINTMTETSHIHDQILIAVNELKTDQRLRALGGFIKRGARLFIDSGIFNLTMEHVRKHPEMSMDDALALAPDQIDGFDDLLKRYLQVIKMYGADCWGYIELDQGGRENKIKTREMLEAKGLRPIPVYHPFNDGWDYFDYLAERYDRICFGNIVQASREERMKLVATAWDRHRKYPDLWIHLLGLTPSELLYALPINSGDSSSWLGAVRWNGQLARACGRNVGELPMNFRYELGTVDGEIGSHKAWTMGAYGAHMEYRNWNRHLEGLRGLGFDMYPPLLESEAV